MPTPDRDVAGVTCREVLADLSDLLDGTLPEARAAQLRAHVAGCDWCERFGGRFAGTVRALRASLREPAPVADDLATRLRARLAALRAAP